MARKKRTRGSSVKETVLVGDNDPIPETWDEIADHILDAYKTIVFPFAEDFRELKGQYMFSPLAIRIILEGAQSWEVPEDQLFAYSKVKGEKSEDDPDGFAYEIDYVVGRPETAKETPDIKIHKSNVTNDTRYILGSREEYEAVCAVIGQEPMEIDEDGIERLLAEEDLDSDVEMDELVGEDDNMNPEDPWYTERSEPKFSKKRQNFKNIY